MRFRREREREIDREREVVSCGFEVGYIYMH